MSSKCHCPHRMEAKVLSKVTLVSWESWIQSCRCSAAKPWNSLLCLAIRHSFFQHGWKHLVDRSGYCASRQHGRGTTNILLFASRISHRDSKLGFWPSPHCLLPKSSQVDVLTGRHPPVQLCMPKTYSAFISHQMLKLKEKEWLIWFVVLVANQIQFRTSWPSLPLSYTPNSYCSFSLQDLLKFRGIPRVAFGFC